MKETAIMLTIDPMHRLVRKRALRLFRGVERYSLEPSFLYAFQTEETGNFWLKSMWVVVSRLISKNSPDRHGNL